MTDGVNEATFIFTLIDARTREPFADNVIKFFAFSYFDFDEEKGNKAEECLKLVAPAETKYHTSFVGSEVAATKDGNALGTNEEPNTFCSTRANGRSNNPAYPSDIGVPTWQDGQNGQDGQLTYVGGSRPPQASSRSRRARSEPPRARSEPSRTRPGRPTG